MRGSSVLSIGFVGAILLATLPVPANVSAADLPNFHKVTPLLYRGAQPSAAGFAELKKLGIATVIDLREGGHSKIEQILVESRGLRYISMPLPPLEAPTHPQVGTLLAMLNDATLGTIFIHCQRGADRTGTIIACYRISHDHWSNAEALAEAKQHGISALQVAMQRYVKAYQTSGP